MAPLRLSLVSLLIAISTVLHVLPLLVVALVKAALPSARLRKASNPVLTGQRFARNAYLHGGQLSGPHLGTDAGGHSS